MMGSNRNRANRLVRLLLDYKTPCPQISPFRIPKMANTTVSKTVTVVFRLQLRSAEGFRFSVASRPFPTEDRRREAPELVPASPSRPPRCSPSWMTGKLLDLQRLVDSKTLMHIKSFWNGEIYIMASSSYSVAASS